MDFSTWNLIAYFLLIFYIKKLNSVSTESSIVCQNNICLAGKIDIEDGKCLCCIKCETSFYRKQGNMSCPLIRSDCSDECILGYENVELRNKTYWDYCRKIRRTTTKIPIYTFPDLSKNSTDTNATYLPTTKDTNDLSSNELSNSGTSAIIVSVVCAIIAVIIIIIIILIYRIKCKQAKTDKSGDNGHVRCPVENTDMSAYQNTDLTFNNNFTEVRLD